MKLKGKFLAVIILSSLVPLLVISGITYESAKKSLEEKIGNSFTSLAQETIDKIDRNIYERLQNIKAWVSLGTMQDIMIEDEDGRISSDLKRLRTDYGVYHDIYVFNRKGENIASSGRNLLGTFTNYPFYHGAAKGGVVIEDVGISDLNKQFSMIFSAPVRADYDKNKIIGVLASSFNWDKIHEIINSVKIGANTQDKSTFVLLINKEGKVISAPESMIGTDIILKQDMSLSESFNKAMNGNSGYTLEEINNRESVVGFASSEGYLSYEGLGWSLLVVQDTNLALAEVKALKLKILWVLIITMIAMVCIAIIVSSQLVTPIKNMITKISAVAHGDLNVNMDYKSRDEIGQMASSMDEMISNLKNMVGMIANASSSIASSSGELSVTTEQITSGINEQSSQLEQSSSATSEVAQTIIEVASNAADASESVRESVETANEGKTVVEQTVSSMLKISDNVEASSKTIGELGESSKKIGDIIDVINDIANQTNLLALNAAIEAARAGEQGRGFAVVADEVRKLAEKTSQATEEIAGMINKIQSDTDISVQSMNKNMADAQEGVVLSRRAQEALNKIVTASECCLDKVNSIAAASEQQSAAVEEVSSNVENIASNFKTSRDAVSRFSQSAAELAEISSTLMDHISWFKTDLQKADQSEFYKDYTVPTKGGNYEGSSSGS